MNIKKKEKKQNCREILLKRGVIQTSKESHKSLSKKKPTISSCTPVKVLIDSVDTYLSIFADIINSSTRNVTYP